MSSALALLQRGYTFLSLELTQSSGNRCGAYSCSLLVYLCEPFCTTLKIRRLYLLNVLPAVNLIIYRKNFYILICYILFFGVILRQMNGATVHRSKPLQ